MDIESNAGDGGAAIGAAESQVSETVSHETMPDAGKGSARDSIDRAFAQMEKQDAPQGEAVSEKPRAERNRTPDGKYAPGSPEAIAADAEAAKEAAPVVEEVPGDEAPSRFSPDAKAAWKDAPAAIKGEIKRALTELENGINHYKAYGEQFRGVEQYAQMAANNGKTLDTVLKSFVGAEQMLRQNPIQGVTYILSNMGISPHEVAAAILGAEPSQQAAQSDRVIYELRQQIGQLQQQVGTVSQTFEQQQTQAAMQQIEQFKANKPRFDELRNDMKFFMETARAQTLDEAYALAERLNPAPASATPQPPAAAASLAVPSPNPSAQTRKAALSVTGAPTAGSNPANRKAPASARESLDRAFASVGLG